MPAPATIDDFLDVVRKSKQLDTDRLVAYLDERRQNDTLPPDPRKLAALLIREGMLTNFQAEQFLQGKYKGFELGGYRILERLGQGGTGTVYLAEHEVMKRRAAIKILPPALASDPAILERFRREAQAAAVLDHPNIVHAYDFRQEGNAHFLVMEYVDGPSLEDVLHRDGPLPVEAACEYARQAAVGLQHAHEAGLVHRDVKPANLLVDGAGTVKLLDLGLARFTPNGAESVTKKFDENVVMGTADYLAPEQALSLHDVDHRADVYSLGATLYALLAGEPPFHSGTVTQKLLWHQMRDPMPLQKRRPDVPEELCEIVSRMMAKGPDDRYASCAEVAEALAPFCGSPLPQAGRAGPTSTEGNSTASYLASKAKPAGGPSTRRRKAAVAAASSELTTTPEESQERALEGPSIGRREIPDVRNPPSSGSGAGLMILGGVMTLILVTVGGVVAFLVWGPQPKAPLVRADKDRDEDRPKQELPPPIVPRPEQQPKPPDALAPLLELREGNVGMERLAIAADGQRVAVGCSDKQVRVWHLERRAVIHKLSGHTGVVQSVAFSRDGKKVLSASADGTARLWDLSNNRAVKTFNPKLDAKIKRLWCAAFANDDAWVVTCGDETTIRLWEVNSGKMIREFAGHKGTVNWVAVRPGKNEILSASWDKTLRLWNLEDNKKQTRSYGHPQGVATCAFTPDGKLVLSGSHDAKMRVYAPDNGTVRQMCSEPKDQLWTLAVSPDSRRALLGGKEKAIHLWDLKHQKSELSIPNQPGEVTGLAFSPDGRHFVSCTKNGFLRLYALPPVQP